jgi:hypothetical protein
MIHYLIFNILFLLVFCSCTNTSPELFEYHTDQTNEYTVDEETDDTKTDKNDEPFCGWKWNVGARYLMFHKPGKGGGFEFPIGAMKYNSNDYLGTGFSMLIPWSSIRTEETKDIFSPSILMPDLGLGGLAFNLEFNVPIDKAGIHPDLLFDLGIICRDVERKDRQTGDKDEYEYIFSFAFRASSGCKIHLGKNHFLRLGIGYAEDRFISRPDQFEPMGAKFISVTIHFPMN